MTAQVIRDDVILWQEFPITLIENNSNEEIGSILLAQLDIVIAALESKEGCVCVWYMCVCMCANMCVLQIIIFVTKHLIIIFLFIYGIY